MSICLYVYIHTHIYTYVYVYIPCHSHLTESAYKTVLQKPTPPQIRQPILYHS